MVMDNRDGRGWLLVRKRGDGSRSGQHFVFKTAASSDTTVHTGYTFGRARLLFRADTLKRRIAGFAETEIKREVSDKRGQEGREVNGRPS